MASAPICSVISPTSHDPVVVEHCLLLVVAVALLRTIAQGAIDEGKVRLDAFRVGGTVL